MKTRSYKSAKPPVCSEEGCKKILRSNSYGDTCYEHRVAAPSKKSIEQMRPKDKSHVAGNRRGKYYNVLRSIDILFLVINPTHRDCEMKFVFLESADISAYKLFKAFSRMKGMTNSAITIGGIQSISSKRPLHLADINHAMKKFIPEINRFFPDVKDSGFKKVPQVYVVGERGLKKSDKRIAE